MEDLILYLASQKGEEIDPNLDDYDYFEAANEFLFDYYGIDLEIFEGLIRDLTPLCNVGESPLTGKLLRGFGDNIQSLWLYKEEVD